MIEEKKIQADEVELKRGITWRSLLGIIYSAAVIQPVVIWIYLATGNLILGLATYATIFVFSELAALSGKPLTKQEILIFMVGSQFASIGVYLWPNLVYNLYLRRHPLIASIGIAALIPDWFAPNPKSPVWNLQTFFHPDWITPITLNLVMIISSILVDLSLGFLTRELYVIHEKLAFPIAQVQASICETLADRKPSRLKIFTFSSLISFIYGIILYAIPTLSEAILNRTMVVLPLPWIDLNSMVEHLVPGASLGIATDITVIAIGLILPPVITISVLIGSLAFYFVGNSLLVSIGLFTEWTPGMNLQNAWQRSILNYWAGPTIALGIAAGIMPLIINPRAIIDSFRSLLRIPTAGGEVSLKLILLMYLAGIAIGIVTAVILVPQFPFWIFILLSGVWPFVINIISARSLGVTGLAINIPYVREGTIMASGYEGIDVWFAPTLVPAAAGVGGAQWCERFKVAELTSTSPIDLVRAMLIAFPLALTLGFIYTQMFWTIAPIPSSLFPAPFWDINVTMTTLFLKRQATVFRPDWMAVTLVVGVVLQLLISFLRLPISLIGIAMGATWPIANAVGIMIGFMSLKILEHLYGKSWINQQKVTIVAGLFTGEGLIVAFSAAAAIISKSIWIRPI